MDLTFQRISQMPKRNTSLFMSEYLQSQRTLQKHFVAEGVVESRSWDTSHEAASPCTEKHGALTASSRALGDFLLGTPLLKPRAASTTKRKAPLQMLENPRLKANISCTRATPLERRSESPDSPVVLDIAQESTSDHKKFEKQPVRKAKPGDLNKSNSEL